MGRSMRVLLVMLGARAFLALVSTTTLLGMSLFAILFALVSVGAKWRWVLTLLSAIFAHGSMVVTGGWMLLTHIGSLTAKGWVVPSAIAAASGSVEFMQTSIVTGSFQMTVMSIVRMEAVVTVMVETFRVRAVVEMHAWGTALGPVMMIMLAAIVVVVFPMTMPIVLVLFVAGADIGGVSRMGGVPHEFVAAVVRTFEITSKDDNGNKKRTNNYKSARALRILHHSDWNRSGGGFWLLFYGDVVSLILCHLFVLFFCECWNNRLS